MASSNPAAPSDEAEPTLDATAVTAASNATVARPSLQESDATWPKEGTLGDLPSLNKESDGTRPREGLMGGLPGLPPGEVLDLTMLPSVGAEAAVDDDSDLASDELSPRSVSNARVAPGATCAPHKKAAVYNRLYEEGFMKEQQMAEKRRQAALNEELEIARIRNMVHHQKGATKRGITEELRGETFKRLFGDAKERKLRSEQAHSKSVEDFHKNFSRKSKASPDGEGKFRWEKLYDDASKKRDAHDEKLQNSIHNEQEDMKTKSIHSRMKNGQSSSACNRLFADSLRREWKKEIAKLESDERTQRHLEDNSVHKRLSIKGTEKELARIGKRLHDDVLHKQQRMRERQRADGVANELKFAKVVNVDTPDKPRFELLFHDASRRKEDMRIKEELHGKRSAELLRASSVHNQANQRHRNQGEIQQIFERCFQAKSLASYRSIRAALRHDDEDLEKRPLSRSQMTSQEDLASYGSGLDSPKSQPTTPQQRSFGRAFVVGTGCGASLPSSPHPIFGNATSFNSGNSQPSPDQTGELEDDWVVHLAGRTGARYTAQASLHATMTDQELERLHEFAQQRRSGRPRHLRRGGPVSLTSGASSAGEPEAFDLDETDGCHDISVKRATERDGETLDDGESEGARADSSIDETVFTAPRFGDASGDQELLLDWWKRTADKENTATLPEEWPNTEPAESRFDNVYGSEGRRYTTAPDSVAGHRIQSMHRGRLGRQIDTGPGSFAQKIVTRVQEASRNLITSKQMASDRDKELDLRTKAAQRIQAILKGTVARRRYKAKLDEKNHAKTRNSVCRAYARGLLRDLDDIEDYHGSLKDKSAKIIQSRWRDTLSLRGGGIQRIKSILDPAAERRVKKYALRWLMITRKRVEARAVPQKETESEEERCPICPTCKTNFLDDDCRFCWNCGARRPESSSHKQMRPKNKTEVKRTPERPPNVRRNSLDSGKKALMSSQDLIASSDHTELRGFESSKRSEALRTRGHDTSQRLAAKVNNMQREVDPSVQAILRQGRLGVEPGGLVKLRMAMRFEERHYGLDYVDAPSAEFEDADSLAPMFEDVVQIYKLTGSNVDIVRCRNVSKIEALEGEHLRWCDELAMNRVLRIRDEIIRQGVHEGACVARVVEGAQEDVYIRFSTDDGKVLSSLVSFNEGSSARDQQMAERGGAFQNDKSVSPRGGAGASTRKTKSKSAKKQPSEKPKPASKTSTKAKGKAKS